MKKFQFRSGIGLAFILLFILNIGLVVVAVIINNHLLIGLGIVLSCFQYYLHDLSRRRNSTLMNYPFGHWLKDLFSFIPRKITRLFTTVHGTTTELTKREQQLLIRRSKSVETMVVDNNLLNKHDPGFEYLQTHPAFMSLSPLDLRVEVGTAHCLLPYSLSVFNFGALDRGAMKKASVHAVSQAANICSCAVNSGEKGLTPELVRGGGDIIWQISYGDIALRNPDCSINEGLLKTIACKPYVKMIELRLQSTQNADHQSVLNERAIFALVSKLQVCSGGKPVGIHVLNPAKETIDLLVRSMASADICLDFINIEESWVLNRLLHKADDQRFFEAVFTAKNLFLGYGIQTKVMATGVILSEYDILRLCALGADACFSAAGALMENGLLQQKLMRRSSSPSVRLANFQRNTVEANRTLMQQCGYEHLSDADPADFFRRINAIEILSLSEIFCQMGQERSMPLYVHLN
ncbi:glutamate synthase-related protein [Arcticibacter eurypsychrophilus]|uniref:glutamate synthase-related protein n=1 Tax=Arcticibacter eurypsychrophilus TaxID=1434752 RepID=UPI00084DE175|nr:hypothetical protein [Arcticibacter eurypsychrophilus]